MSDLVGNPEDRFFSRVAAYLIDESKNLTYIQASKIQFSFFDTRNDCII